MQDGIHTFKSEEYEIVCLLSSEYPVETLCQVMSVSKAGYYKWKNRDVTARSVTRAHVVELVSEVHASHPSLGYRWVAAFIRINYQESYSDNYIYKAFKYLNITAQTKHKV